MRFLTTRAIATLAIPAWLIACSNSTTDPTPQCVVNSVTVTGAPATLSVGSTVQLGATVDSDNCSTTPTVGWTTSNGSFANVSNAGLVTGVGAGSVTITATAGGKSGTATFDVEIVPVASVRLSTEDIVIGVGPAHTLTAEALDASDAVLPGRTVTWSVTGGAGATVSPTGTLTGVTAGQTAIVTATIEGVTADVAVHVVRSRLGFFWNSLVTPGAVPVAPSETYRYNSLGGALLVSSGATGRYVAAFEGLGREDNETEAYFLSAYATPFGAFCWNDGWTETSVNVACASSDGTAADMRFTVAQVSSASFSGRYGYSWIPSGTNSVEGHLSYRYNPTGGSIFSVRQGTGNYEVTFEGLGRRVASDREAVIVDAYGANATCQPASWTTVGADLVIQVRCFAADGTDIDTRFSVLVVDGNRTGATLGFAHADQPSTGAYAPANSAVRPSGSVQVNRNSTGQYSVAFTGVYRSGDLRETFLVSPTGTTPGRCQIAQWSLSSVIGTPTSVFITCTTPAGVAADLPFSIVALQ